jgi:nitrite reductase/ring-hydroxylating ferredoxin subunit
MWFRKKQTRWFMAFSSVEKAREWVPMNKTVRIEVDHRLLCLTRTVDGFFATNEKCPHQKLPLTHGGFVENGALVCPFHRYAWDLKTGREIERRCDNIELFEVEERPDGLFIGIR